MSLAERFNAKTYLIRLRLSYPKISLVNIIVLSF